MITTYDFAFSEQGYNHIKSDKVCQDSSGHYSDDSMAVIVVADGHGSDNYPRTDRGSSFAVEATINAIREFVNTVQKNAIDISLDSNSYLEQLAKNILANWYAAVDIDLKKYPFSEEELSKVSEKYKKRYLSGEHKEKAYGTTLIAVCQTKNYWFGLQIGDGKCVCISADGAMYEPIPWDEDCQANVTTSICDSEAIDEFRYCYMQDCPIATLIGTDGIDDSYTNNEELYVLYRSILAIFAEHGSIIGENEIQAFLPGLSRKGSGDDVSIAGIVSSVLSATFIDVLKAQCEYSNAKARREQADREVTLAAEKQEYIHSAMKKAKMNYELCVQKATEAQEAIEVAQRNQEDAIKRFETAKIALSSAVTAYQSSIVSKETDEVVVETAPVVAIKIEEEKVTTEQGEAMAQDSVCKEPVEEQPVLVETDEIKSAEKESTESGASVHNKNAHPTTDIIKTDDNG